MALRFSLNHSIMLQAQVMGGLDVLVNNGRHHAHADIALHHPTNSACYSVKHVLESYCVKHIVGSPMSFTCCILCHQALQNQADLCCCS